MPANKRVYCRGCRTQRWQHAAGLCFYCYQFGLVGQRYKGPIAVQCPPHQEAEKQRRMLVYQKQVGEGGLMRGGKLDFLAAQRLP